MAESTITKEQYLSNKYKKWDNFKDDSDSEGEDVPRKPTQFDVEGEDDIVVSTELLLTSKQIEKFKRLDKPHQEVWQVVVRKLRVWTASSQGADDGKDAIACRPYCILVNNLYPLGQVISKKICDPPEVYPSPQEILDVTLQAMLDPPTNTPQHRPDKICFPDKFYVGKLRKSFAAIGIECSYLSESQGIDAYISELSKQLVRKDLASVAEVSERPGLVSGEGVTADLLKGFYAACAKYAELEPWNRLAERQAIQIDAQEVITIDKRHEVGRGSVFGSVVGTNTSEGQIQGMALFFTRSDLERRVMPAGSKLAYMENSELRRCAYCDKKAPKGSELKRCTRCKCVFYCGANCQRAHWKDHKINCVAQSDVAEQKDKKIVWGAKEMSILFGAQTSLPFDDLDVIDKHSFKIAKVRGEELYPSPMVFKYGEASIPTITDLLWLTRGLLAHVELLEKHPLFMQATMSSLLGMDEDESEEAQQPKIELAVESLGFNDRLVLRNSTVLTMEDVTKLRDYVTKKKTEAEVAEVAEAKAAEAAEGATETSPLVDDAASAAAQEGDDQGKCAIM